MKPKHCKGCVHFHNAGHSTPRLHKFNAWCCSKGAAAAQSVGWCKTHNKKNTISGRAVSANGRAGNNLTLQLKEQE